MEVFLPLLEQVEYDESKNSEIKEEKIVEIKNEERSALRFVSEYYEIFHHNDRTNYD